MYRLLRSKVILVILVILTRAGGWTAELPAVCRLTTWNWTRWM